MKKQIIAILLSLSLILTFLPTGAFAQDRYVIDNISNDKDVNQAISYLISALIDKTFDQSNSYSHINPYKVRHIKKYTALGDSMVFGYGMSDMFVSTPMFDNHYGYGVASQGKIVDPEYQPGKAWGLLLAEKLGLKVAKPTYCKACNEKHPLYIDCTHKGNDYAQLSIGALRAEDLLSILTYNSCMYDFMLNNAVKQRSYFKNWGLNEFFKYVRPNDGLVYSEKALKKNFFTMQRDVIKNIKASDLITVTVGGNNLGSFFGYVDGIEGGNFFDEQFDFEIKKYIGSTEGLNYVIELVSNLLTEAGVDVNVDFFEGNFVDLVAKYLIYSYLSIAVSVPKIVNEIHKLNKHAIIVLTGIYNPLDSLVATIGDSDLTIKVGAVFNILFNLMNSSMRNCAIQHPDYCAYIDISNTELIINTNDVRISVDGLLTGEVIDTITNNHSINSHESAEGHKFIADTIYNTLLHTTRCKAGRY